LNVGLIILVIIAFVIGYWLAKSRASQTIDDTAEKAVNTTRSVVTSTSDRLRGRPSSVQFKAWAAGSGAEYLPDDFKNWLAGLSEDDAQAFTNALNDYLRGLKLDLKALLDGKVADAGSYAQAIVTYSQSYRSAHGG
jgi:CHASE3 domain sensor protein